MRANKLDSPLYLGADSNTKDIQQFVNIVFANTTNRRFQLLGHIDFRMSLQR